MGLFRRLVLLPVAPVEGVSWIGRQVLAVAEQHDDEGAIRSALADLDRELEEGRITKEAHDEAADDLLDRLVDMRKAHDG